MMHVAIPASLSVADPSNNGQSYDVFKIFVNGAYHCTLRYSQLLRLHETIKTEYGDIDLPEFPPKKIKLIMSSKQKIERREALQQYLRAVCQHVITTNSRLVNEFFLESQKESAVASKECQNLSDELPIYLLDGTKTAVACNPGDCSSVIMRRYAEAVGLQSQNVPLFGLFILRKSSTCPYELVRWLKDFECPSLSLLSVSGNTTNGGKSSYKVVVRKCFWDPAFEKAVIRDRVASNIVYTQAVAEMQNWRTPSVLLGARTHSTAHWSQLNEDTLRQLQRFNEQNSSLEFLSLCASQPRYGFLYFEPCTSDYLAPDQTVCVAAGNRQLILLHKGQAGGLVEASFRVTRIRCWKLSNQESEESPNLSFEYLISRNRLDWITLHSPQAILISMCLQSMVDEIIRCREVAVSSGENFGSRSSNATESPTSVDSGVSSSFGSNKGSKFSYESFGEMGNRKKASTSMTNEAFNTITDDDL